MAAVSVQQRWGGVGGRCRPRSCSSSHTHGILKKKDVQKIALLNPTEQIRNDHKSQHDVWSLRLRVGIIAGRRT